MAVPVTHNELQVTSLSARRRERWSSWLGGLRVKTLQEQGRLHRKFQGIAGKLSHLEVNCDQLCAEASWKLNKWRARPGTLMVCNCDELYFCITVNGISIMQISICISMHKHHNLS